MDYQIPSWYRHRNDQNWVPNKEEMVKFRDETNRIVKENAEAYQQALIDKQQLIDAARRLHGKGAARTEHLRKIVTPPNYSRAWTYFVARVEREWQKQETTARRRERALAKKTQAEQEATRRDEANKAQAAKMRARYKAIKEHDWETYRRSHADLPDLAKLDGVSIEGLYLAIP